jgi:hypothetical protein
LWWLAEFEPGFVMLAARESLVQQGGHTLDPPPPLPQQASLPSAAQELSGAGGEEAKDEGARQRELAVQNRQCWKCDLDK